MTENAKAFLIPALAGVFVAIALGLLARFALLDFDAWIRPIWPTAFMLGAISGHASLEAVAMVISVSAFLNGVYYGIVGWLCYRAWRLAR
jgi:hypothetical protein